MKPFVKTCLITSIISTLYLTSSVSHADPNSLLSAANQLSYQQVNKEWSNGNLLLPSSHYLSAENRIDSAKNKTEKLIHSNCNARKKNELYELSTIFNDKLQLFLAYFSDRPTYTAARKSDDQRLTASSSSQL